MNYFKYFQLLPKAKACARVECPSQGDRQTGEVKVTPVRQMEEHKKPHKEIYAPFKRGTLTHPR